MGRFLVVFGEGPWIGKGGPIVCHNDVCLENVVFRDGEAVGLLDFDFVEGCAETGVGGDFVGGLEDCRTPVWCEGVCLCR